ncbi:hypothetical protein NQZ68_031461 [Dissostichus eleginoides]|nr:hypothetical protein NQZ68_031461 [Dissostichus eleginoides]
MVVRSDRGGATQIYHLNLLKAWTASTPYGLYQFVTLPFGSGSAAWRYRMVVADFLSRLAEGGGFSFRPAGSRPESGGGGVWQRGVAEHRLLESGTCTDSSALGSQTTSQTRFEKLTTVTNILLLNMVVSSLIFMSSLPFEALSNQLSKWIFGDVMCRIVGSVYYLGFYSSVLFLTLLTFDRHLAMFTSTPETQMETTTYDYDYVTLPYPERMSPNDSLGSHLSILYYFMFLFSLFGNGLVLVIIYQFEKLTTVTNILLLNMVVSSLIFMSSLPFEALSNQLSKWIFGDVMCRIVGSVYYLGFYSSVLFLTLLTFDRHLAMFTSTPETQMETTTYDYDYVTLPYPERMSPNDSLGSHLSILYYFMFLFSLFGNGLVLVIIYQFEKLTTVTNILLLNMVVSSLIFMSSLPFEALSNQLSKWIFGDVMCRIVGSVYYLGFYIVVNGPFK